MLIISTRELSQEECYTTKLELSNYVEKEADIVFRADIAPKYVTKVGMPKCIEYSLSTSLVEVVLISEINKDTIKTTPIGDNYIQVELLQPTIIQYKLAIGSRVVPIIIRLEEGFIFEDSLDNVTSMEALKSIITLVAVEATEFPPLRIALQKSMEAELDS